MKVKLVMFKADGQRKDVPITGPVTVLGRGEDCNLRLPVVDVSRRHCELRLSGDKLTVKDLGSSNGTYVNNKRINEAGLDAGDRLVIGPVVFTVQIDGRPEEIREVKTRGQRLAATEVSQVDEVVELEAQPSMPVAPQAPAQVEPEATPAPAPEPVAEPERAAEPVREVEPASEPVSEPVSEVEPIESPAPQAEIKPVEAPPSKKEAKIEPEPSAQPDEFPVPAEEPPAGEEDVIAALEALAAQTEEQDDEQQDQPDEDKD